MHDPYSSDHRAPTARGDSFTIREQEQLAYHRNNGLLRFRDFGAYFCRECRGVFGVYCPNCKIRSATSHASSEEPVFTDGEYTDKWDGSWWRLVICRKCDFRFKVILR